MNEATAIGLYCTCVWFAKMCRALNSLSLTQEQLFCIQHLDICPPLYADIVKRFVQALLLVDCCTHESNECNSWSMASYYTVVWH